MLIDNLRAGRSQHLITYGTSLTADGDWVNQLRVALMLRFPGQVGVTNSGQSGMASTWGLANLDERVVARNPDAVFIEFGINDAYTPYKISVAQSRKNLETMIDRILTRHAECQIIPMTMNPPINEHLDIRPAIEQYYAMYRDVARERKLLLIDHHIAWQEILDRGVDTFGVLVPDGIHPAPEGSRRVTVPNILRALNLA
jgi:lysophospholipase L1-like esterase